MNKNDIIITYGSAPKEMAKEILAAAKIEDMIGDTKKRIGLKPNLVVAKPASTGATTHPEILAGTIEYLQERGFKNITILEGSWVGDRTASAFRSCGFNDLAYQYKAHIVDEQHDTYQEYDCKGMKINICDEAMAIDFMINMPVLKGHCQTSVTCALKNNKGVIPNIEKRRFHSLGLDKPIAHLNTVAKNDFILVDGICGDLDFEEGGNPVPMNRMLGCVDPVLCDAYVCDLMGYSIDEVPYIPLAAKLGVGCCDTSKANVIELKQPEENLVSLRSGRKVQHLAKYAQPKDACSACYGSLIHALNRLDENGYLRRLKTPICIGQGYKGCGGEVGVGQCTCGFDKYVKGCPPKAIDIYNFICDEIL